MCGIAGVISWDEKYRVTRETLQRMSAAIAHRGPDGDGIHLNHEQAVTSDRPQCGFAFRRLAILDPDPRATQPFTIGDKTIVFNGEIYNFRELREELKKLRPDYAWRTTGDTEVLLLAYDVWGEKCLGRLNGMFALAVWDGRERTLFLARDRMGQKPLYVATAGDARLPPDVDADGIVIRNDAVAFASELGALRTLPWFDTAVDGEALRGYLRWGYVPEGRTIYRGAVSLRPAGATKFWSSGLHLPGSLTYFDPNERAAAPPADPVEATRHAVREAVRRQLVADVPLGAFLSGGVDSSVVAACARAAVGAGRPVLTFSAGFPDRRYDETAYAEAVAAHLGTRHRSFVVRPDAASDLPRLAAAFGEPFGDSSALPTYYLSRETRAHVKVALSGDGGDELFGGYDRYRAMSLGNRLTRVPDVVRKLALSRMWSAAGGAHPKSRRARIKRLLATADREPAARYAGYVALFDDALGSALTAAAAGPDGWCGARFAQMTRGGRDVVQAALAVDRITYLPGDLLAKVDRASMRHALEVRSPFMDPDLVRFAAGLSTDQLLKGGPKRMLREAFRDDLPAWVFKRKKMGFAVPIGEWFRGELRAMLRDNLFAADSFARRHFDMNVVERLVDEHERQTTDHSQRLYALLMLELWWRSSR